MTYQEAREYGDKVITVTVGETMARCPKCRRSGMDAVWRRLGDGIQVWGECQSCDGRVAGGMLPKGAGPLEAETRIIEKAQEARVP